MPPTNGLTSAAGALRYWERRQEVVAHNLANVSTDGFKGERVFARLLGQATPVAQTTTDVRAGTLRQTQNPLDLAVAGDGYLVVETPAGERFSRGGALGLDADRRLVDGAGHPVLGDAGPIVVPQGALLTVSPAGAIQMDGRAVAQLRLERVPPGTALAHEGGTLLVPDASRQSVPAAERQIRQGAVEESNVSPVSALVEMISVQRAYASVQKAVTTLDAVRGTAATDLGKPV
jgi:flagellar basal body rod protein FlgG